MPPPEPLSIQTDVTCQIRESGIPTKRVEPGLDVQVHEQIRSIDGRVVEPVERGIGVAE